MFDRHDGGEVQFPDGSVWITGSLLPAPPPPTPSPRRPPPPRLSERVFQLTAMIDEERICIAYSAEVMNPSAGSILKATADRRYPDFRYH